MFCLKFKLRRVFGWLFKNMFAASFSQKWIDKKLLIQKDFESESFTWFWAMPVRPPAAQGPQRCAQGPQVPRAQATIICLRLIVHTHYIVNTI